MKQEEQKYCLNCGNPCHAGVVLTRKEHTYPSEGSKEYEIEVCRHCRCGVVETNDNCKN